jgi:AcrR family transcriptional regulator
MTLTRRDEILAAAAELFAAHGYAAVGIDEIGARAGVTGPAVYRYFPSKEAILTAVIIATSETMIEVMTAFESDAAVGDEALFRSVATIAFDNRAGLATAFREGDRIKGPERLMLDQLGARVAELSAVAFQRINPGLDAVASGIRLAMTGGALRAFMTSDAGVPRPRLDEMFVSSSLAVFRQPPIAPESDPDPEADDADGDARQRWELAPTRRDLILEAALRLFAEGSFHDVGVDDIAGAASVPTRALYRYFRNKLDILVAAYDRVGHRLGAARELALDGAGSARDAVERLCDRVTRVIVADPDLVVVTYRERKAVSKVESPGRFQAWADLEDIWRRALGEARPELRLVDVRLLVEAVVPLLYEGAVAGPEPRRYQADIANLASVHLFS